MIDFEHYAKISNNYCVCYLGYADEYLVQLKLLRPIIERAYPGLNLFIACRDESIEILGAGKRNLTLSGLKCRKSDFAHIKEIRYNGSDHPVEAFVEEIESVVICSNIMPKRTERCLIITKGNHPTKDISDTQLSHLMSMAREEKLNIDLDGSISGVGVVMGVEHPDLFNAAALGIRTILVPNGCGSNLYKKMFPCGEILK